MAMAKDFLDLMTFQFFELLHSGHKELGSVWIIVDHSGRWLVVHRPTIYITTFHAFLYVSQEIMLKFCLHKRHRSECNEKQMWKVSPTILSGTLKSNSKGSRFRSALKSFTFTPSLLTLTGFKLVMKGIFLRVPDT